MTLKGLRTKALAICLAAATGLSACLSGVQVFAGSDSKTYQGGYSVRDVLSNYQFFTEGDMNLGSHTVGAVACGGNFEGNLIAKSIASEAHFYPYNRTNNRADYRTNNRVNRQHKHSDDYHHYR